MTMNFKIGKDIRNSWTAVSSLELPDNRALQILTMKCSNDRIVTSVKVVKIEEKGFSFRFFQDYGKTLITEKKRCTEASVRDQHDRAIAMLPDILPEVYAQYGFDDVKVMA